MNRNGIRYKLQIIGGIKTIFGRQGTDFFLAVFLVIIYLLLFLFLPSINQLWEQPSLVVAAVGILVALQAGFVVFVYSQRRDVQGITDFNKFLERKGLMAGVEFFYDWTVKLLLASIIIWLGFLVSWYVLTNYQGACTFPICIDTLSATSLLFSIPLFSFLYSFFNLYYVNEATQMYKSKELKYSLKTKK